MIQVFFILTVAVLGETLYEDIDALLDQQFEDFCDIFQKFYDEEELYFRRDVFEDKAIANFLHNLQADLGVVLFTRGLNEYSDLTTDEFIIHRGGFKEDPNYISHPIIRFTSSNSPLPDEVDWRNEGLVTPVRDQGLCGACWAFSSTGALESQYAKKKGTLPVLSPQNLLDCSTNDGNDGCNGGSMRAAYDYIKDNNGIDTENSYPYTGEVRSCNFDPSGVGATTSGYVDIAEGDENALKEAVANAGPISVGIDMSLESFQQYKSGIYDDPGCSSTNLMHAVVVIGYGTEDGTDYWLIKNSWGTSWGINGYMKLARNRNNLCGVATRASYPVI